MKPLVAAALLLVSTTVAAQTISSVFPGSGRPGDLVHIAGKGLLNSTALCVSPPCGPFVTIGGAGATVVNSTPSELVVVAPDHAPGAADVTFQAGGFPPSTLSGAYTFEYASPDDYERMLIPVGGPTPGAFGSIWIAPVSAYSEKSMTVRVPYCVSSGTCGSQLNLVAGTPAKFGVDGSSNGAFLYVPREFANDADFTVHVVDWTHPSDSHAEVPVVRARDFRPLLRFLDIPIGANVRSNLRIYGYNAGSVTVTVRDTTSGRITGTTQLQLQGGSIGDFPTYPWTVAITPDLLTGVSHLYTAMLEVTSDNGGPIWAFITLTNNDTQHVDLVLPFRKD